ncbi:putative calmodulin-binding protein Sha1 [Aspergillus homomorphus CBS 101889]|uniref:Calponin-homology (CH) domain-containing protein n=1 Tax=Aspergillus homomorphus (strain CBS 101889) TaxID=1450537 RepID=A0A395HU07_ASPHC|nr:hypothetical protein BO97DRAFT_472196 [Aspergillus homomorphus CBS 101889]RAL09694.1 hypothetical protein BO97DRAFT_472196 [Aspergillus homomorphus CBS 101889]
MSSYIYDATTPCPSRLRISASDRSSDRSSLDSLWDRSITSGDSTEDIDFTTEIRPSVLTGAKPRRKTRSNASFMIHDDHEVDSAQAAHGPRKEVTATAIHSTRKKSLLAQPAQRFRSKVSFVASPQRQSRRSEGVITMSQQQKRQDQLENNELLTQINGRNQGLQSKDTLKKAVRRNTIYIPPDDTTVASVFMGPLSPQKTANVESLLREDTQINSLEAQIARKRQTKRSMNPTAQRAPLNPSSKVLQCANVHVDMPGKNGGKENIPPGSILVGTKKNFKYSKVDELYERRQKVASNETQARRAKHTSNPVKTVLASKTSNQIIRHAEAETKPSEPETEPTKRQSINVSNQTPYFGHSASQIRDPKLDTSATSSGAGKASTLHGLGAKWLVRSSSIIPNDITKPELYEDDWLGHQEIVLTPLLNELFKGNDNNSGCADANRLRQELLNLYQRAPFTQLQKRLKASLFYGALSLPKDALSRTNQIYRDLGLKRKFLDFWVHTYDLEALRAALEVITGRAIPSSKLAAGGRDAAREKAMKRKLEGFLDAFLLQNQDMERHPQDREGDDGDIAGRAYRRTFLRSVMIIVLLDQSKRCSGSLLPHLLFQPSSLHKSSTAVLQALGQLLLPSCGDIIKALHHLDCQLSYEQQPLAEYEFWISNIAVDLRDGVKLARLVELLVLKPATPGEVGDQKWPLSNRLKFPCVGRAVKLFNVQITLDTLRSIDETRQLVHMVRAEDIVDGHREKTLQILSGLVSTWGIDRLLDCGELRREDADLDSLDTLGAACNEIRRLLKGWANLLAESNGLHLENFSTDFSDGKIYECIVNEYGNILDSDEHLCDDSKRAFAMESRLRVLGCSAELVRIICPPSGAHIPDTDFTIGVLAFLCSRILSATKRAPQSNLEDRGV